MLIDPSEVINTGTPAIALGEKAHILRGPGSAAMAPVVTGVNCVTRAGQRIGESRIAASVFGQSMGNLQRGFGRRRRLPAIDKKLSAIGGTQSEVECLHRTRIS